MSFPITPRSDDFTPYMKYDARDGRCSIRPEGSDDDINIQNPRLAIDWATMGTCWILSGPGIFEKTMNPPEQKLPAPTPKHREGVVLNVFGSDAMPNVGRLGHREWTSSANAVLFVIKELYEEWEMKEGHEDQAGVYQMMEAVKTKSKNRVYQPVFHFEKWINRMTVQAFADIPLLTAAVISVVDGDPQPEPPPEAYVEDDIPF